MKKRYGKDRDFASMLLTSQGAEGLYEEIAPEACHIVLNEIAHLDIQLTMHSEKSHAHELFLERMTALEQRLFLFHLF